MQENPYWIENFFVKFRLLSYFIWKRKQIKIVNYLMWFTYATHQVTARILRDDATRWHSDLRTSILLELAWPLDKEFQVRRVNLAWHVATSLRDIVAYVNRTGSL